MSTNEDIAAAIAALDPANDEHWTTDGLPRLDAVEAKMPEGASSVSRKLVTNAAPNHNRGYAQSLVDAAEDEETAGPTEDVDAEPPTSQPPDDANGSATDEAAKDDEQPAAPDETEQPDAAATQDDEQDGFDPLATGPAEQEAAMDEDILRLQQHIEDIRRGLAEGQRVLQEAEAEHANLVDAKNRAFPPMSAAQAIRQFQQSELAKRTARAATTKAIAEMIGNGDKNEGLDADLRKRKRPIPGAKV